MCALPVRRNDASARGLFERLVFERGAHTIAQLPPVAGPEIAFGGRSNAGKSSALNALARRNRLAFVSKTPGRTQQINFFRMPAGGYLVDLPGYGYAKVPEELKFHWQRVLARYLRERPSLRGLVLIMDVRHPLTPLDEQMLDWFAPTGLPVHVLLSKADKFSRSEQSSVLRGVSEELRKRGPNITAQLFSSLKKTGLEAAEAKIGEWLTAVDVDSPVTG